MLFAIGLVSTFITGGLTGIILGDSTLDINVHDTYFVVCIFIWLWVYLRCTVCLQEYTTGFHCMFGRMLNKNLGYIHFWLLLYVLMVFFPMHFIGLAGLPRRYYTTQIFHYLMTYRMLMC
jgi:cytochrome c oxidase subunit 1